MKKGACITSTTTTTPIDRELAAIVGDANVSTSGSLDINGVAPAAVLYLWTMQGLHGLGWAIVLFFAVCCALRLARFNAGVSAELPS